VIGAAIALAGYVGFLVIVFGVRTDRSRFVPFASRADAFAGGLLGVALLCTLGAPVLVLLDRIERPTTNPFLMTAGTVVLVAGIAIALVAQHQLGDAWRPGIDPDDRVALVTTGLYRHSRNPFYSGWIIANVGMLLLVLTIAEVVGLVLLVAAIEIVVRFVEEPALRNAHGAAFDRYVRQRRRF
jgi:protein-S-isoprenylcysteine O-methyltransferase Ste14